jgi:ABC-type sugar transport system ATPase subunit
VTHLPPARPRTALMFQRYALFLRIDWVDNVAFSPRMRRVPKVELA